MIKAVYTILLMLCSLDVFGQALTAQQATNRLNLIAPTLPLSGSFEQLKYFKVLKHPLKSQGEFEVNRQRLIWQTLMPVKSAVLYENETLYTVNSRGEKTPTPQGGDVSTLIFSLLQGEFEELDKTFSLSPDKRLNCILMTPNSAPLSLALNKVVLCGQGAIDRIELFDSKNNKTAINLQSASSK
ncbi:outer membrane lipoprotein carrier protein LolA [Pseudoalteromonas luteoviolacea]|uniref:outer membrane lipoprotein carrier protein LolA n=1 Tax=Pseudoalteromonas luteoviolacea TaxID=43657 RepID=UPI0011542947|nr:outer membrane lipoprotein carrier protein LolA [Pseudoalteromonas luteoviolacea]TQF69599.1 outer membrane lipoprotein carrier protein LolA [Pseudoalteromonas luteoviolacea]